MFGTFPTVIFFFSFYYRLWKKNYDDVPQQGLQKKYCKAEVYCFGAWGQAETSLKIVDLSWKYPKNNEQIKIKRQWPSPWGTSEIHGPFLGSPGPVPMHRMNPLSKALLCTTLDSVNPVLYPSIDTMLCVLLNIPAASVTAKMSFSVYWDVWELVLVRLWRMTGYLLWDWCIFTEILKWTCTKQWRCSYLPNTKGRIWQF
jgi:hypothetical protein